MGKYTIKKPLNFSSSEEYEKWKRRKKEVKDEIDNINNPHFNMYKFYYTYIQCGHRTKQKEGCVIAAETQYEAEQIFKMVMEYFEVDRPRVRNIEEVYWLHKDNDRFINFLYDFSTREIKEVYQEDYLEYYWKNFLKL